MKLTRDQIAEMRQELNALNAELETLESQKEWFVGLDGFDPSVRPEDKDSLDDLNNEIEAKAKRVAEIQGAFLEYCAS